MTADSTPDTLQRQQASILIPYQRTTGIIKNFNSTFSPQHKSDTRTKHECMKASINNSAFTYK